MQGGIRADWIGCRIVTVRLLNYSNFKNIMKKLIILGGFCWMLSGCSLFRHQKYGCPTNGKNIGAERILSGDKAAIKASKKAGKFNH